ELIDSEINRSLITKVLFLGDKAQIPPIGDQLSPIFTIENSYQLTQLMRQATDNPLAPLTQQLRNVNNQLPEFLIKKQTLLSEA
ncbi:disulfide oxidoreductase, partial [Francisella tularensis subsp. holarctica]|nr:disulfide oxidoreductase [Francisella tularensis subsp. holarctica]